MKKTMYMGIALAGLLLTSCFQDLGQDPPFDYPQQPTPPPLGADGQIFYLSFDKDFEEYQSLSEALPTGTPSLTDGKKGKAYTGAKDSYLTFDVANLAAPLGSSMTFAFWYKLNPVPDRAGLLVLAPKTEGKPADKQNNRKAGFRIFREKAGAKQRIKANVGNGTADSWLDGSAKADLDPETNAWKYVALVLTEGKAFFYLDGEEVAATNLTRISWDGCDLMSIGSGAPRFNEWNHLSDHSLIDELRIYNKALSAAEIKQLMNK